MKTISIIGLGKLGSPMVAAFSSRGFRVIGVDVNPGFVAKLKNGRAPVREPGLQAMLTKYRSRITATMDIREAVLGSEITFIIVPTPSTHNGGFSTTFAAAVAHDIGSALRDKKDYHLVGLTSTVLPGSSEMDIIPAIEKASGKKCGKDFGFCYSPEFVALGSVIRDMLNPDFMLVGEADRKSGDTLEAFHRRISRAPVHRMAIVNAELAKIAVNTFITKKISFANMIAQICDRLPGGDVDAVTKAIGSDTRIGNKYLRGGLGFGGPCFPRDNRAFTLVARTARASYHLPRATDLHNREHLKFTVRKTAALTPKGGKVAILGVAYKPDTEVTEESQGLHLAQALARQGFRVSWYDPAAPAVPKEVRLVSAQSLAQAVRGAATVCITTPWPEFRNLKPQQLPRNVTVVDFWRVLDPAKFPKHRIVKFGVNSQQHGNT